MDFISELIYQYHSEEWKVRVDLAAAYRLCFRLGLCEGVGFLHRAKVFMRAKYEYSALRASSKMLKKYYQESESGFNLATAADNA